MALTERLALLVALDAQGAIRGFDKLGKAADRNLAKTTNRIDVMGQTLQKVGIGMAASGGVLAVGLFKAAQASEEANLAVVKLDNSLKNNPKLAGESSKAFIDLADSIQDKTAADGDAIVAGEAMLATFRVTGDQIRELTPLVVDYARKFGVDLVTANASVGKALDGNVGALKRNGVSIDEVLFKTDRYAAVQKALAEQVGGFAEAEGKTFAGSLERLKNQMGDLAEGVGVGAVDAFSSMFDAVDGGIQKLNKLDPALLETAGQLGAIGSVGLVAAGGIAFVAGKVIELRKSIQGLSGVTGVFAGVAAGVAGLTAAWALYDSVIRSAQAAGAGEVAGLKEQFEGLDPAKASISDLRNVIGGLKGDLADASAEAARSEGFFDQDKLAQLNAGIVAGDKWLAQLEMQERAAKNLALELGVTENEAYRLILANEDTADAAGAAGGAFDGEAAAASALVTQLTEAKDALTALFDPLFAMEDALSKEAEAQIAVTEATNEFGAGSAEAVQAQEDLARAVIDTDSAALLLNAAMQDGTVDLDESRRKLDEWVASGRITEEQAAVIAWNLGVAAAKADEYSGDYKANVGVTGVETSMAQLDRLIGKLGVVRGTYIANMGLGLLYGVPKAAGGPVYLAGGGGPRGTDTVPAWLTPGEFVMRKSAVDRIGMANLSAMNAGGVSGGGSTSVTINVDGGDPQRVVEAVSRYIKSNGQPAWLR